MKFGGFFYITFSKIVYLLKKICEWKTLFIPIVTDTQIAALVIDERQKGKNPPNEFPLYQCTQEPRGMTLRNHTNSVP